MIKIQEAPYKVKNKLSVERSFQIVSFLGGFYFVELCVQVCVFFMCFRFNIINYSLRYRGEALQRAWCEAVYTKWDNGPSPHLCREALTLHGVIVRQPLFHFRQPTLKMITRKNLKKSRPLQRDKRKEKRRRRREDFLVLGVGAAVMKRVKRAEGFWGILGQEKKRRKRRQRKRGCL